MSEKAKKAWGLNLLTNGLVINHLVDWKMGGR